MNINQHSDFPKFLKNFAYVLAGIILSDLVIGAGMGYLYKKQRSGLLYRTTYSIDSTRADYVIMGSSRANHDYDPKVLENKMGNSFYNCGRDKQGAIYSCAVLSAILDRYTPKCIIFDIRPDDFTSSEEGELSTLLPYHKNKAIRPYLNFNGKFQGVKLLSSIYPYNSLFTNLIVGLDKNHKEDYNGYVGLNEIDQDKQLVELKEGDKPDTTKIKVFYQMLEKVSGKHIPIILVIAPIHYHYINSITVSLCQKAAEKYSEVTFLNFTNRSNWMDNKLYSDNNHLNISGAKRFSGELATFLPKSK